MYINKVARKELHLNFFSNWNVSGRYITSCYMKKTYLFKFCKGPFTHPILRIRFLVPKIGSRRSDGPISRFRFCGENVGRSFVVCSHDPIFGTDKESSIWRQNDHRDIMESLSAPFIFQEECRMKIEHVLFRSVFSNLQIRVSEGHF